MLAEDTEALEVRLLLEAIFSRHGYDFRDYAPDSMARRLATASAKIGAKNLGELQHRLITEPATFHVVLDLLTVRVTEMFRDPTTYRALREQVVPALRTYPQLKVWHAGCASGEEVYATAILLSEAGLYERTQIYATDVSYTAVEQTRDGVYEQQLFAAFARNYHEAGGEQAFEAYFSRGYERIAVLPALKKNVHVFQHDLSCDYSLGEMQLIFCRNVLIYFGDELRRRVFKLLAEGLSRGGFLCLGSSESLPAYERAAYAEIAPAERIYRRRGSA